MRSKAITTGLLGISLALMLFGCSSGSTKSSDGSKASSQSTEKVKRKHIQWFPKESKDQQTFVKYVSNDVKNYRRDIKNDSRSYSLGSKRMSLLPGTFWQNDYKDDQGKTQHNYLYVVDWNKKGSSVFDPTKSKLAHDKFSPVDNEVNFGRNIC